MANLAGRKLWRMYLGYLYISICIVHLFIHYFLFYLYIPQLCIFLIFFISTRFMAICLCRAIVISNILGKFAKNKVIFLSIWGQSLQNSEGNINLRSSEVTCVVGWRNSTPSWLMLTKHGDGQPRWLTF